MDTPTREMRVQFVLGEKTWELDVYDLTVDQSIAMQKVTGRTWLDLSVAFDLGDAEATKAFFWAARRHAGEALPYDDPAMNFRWRDFTSRVLRDSATQPAPIS